MSDVNAADYWMERTVELQTEIDRLRAERDDWKNTLEDFKKMRDIKDQERKLEIDVLRAELEDAQRQADIDRGHQQSDKVEIDVLCATNAELKGALEDCFNTWLHEGNLVSAFGRASVILAKTAKEGE